MFSRRAAPRAAHVCPPRLHPPGQDSRPAVSDARFPVDVRLLRAADFKRVLATGRRRHDACFTVVVLPNNLQTSRLGLTVSRRAARLAVQRNRIKRLVRESFRQHRKYLPAMDIVVMAKPRATDSDNPALCASLTWHWQQIN